MQFVLWIIVVGGLSGLIAYGLVAGLTQLPQLRGDEG